MRKRRRRVLDEMKRPAAFTAKQLISAAGSREIANWLRERKNRRVISIRLEPCGYVPVRNDTNKTGNWVVGGERQAIYGLASLSPKERFRQAGIVAVGGKASAESTKNPESTENASASNVHPLYPQQTKPSQQFNQKARTREGGSVAADGNFRSPAIFLTAARILYFERHQPCR
jgi:hypothetical protein